MPPCDIDTLCCYVFFYYYRSPSALPNQIGRLFGSRKVRPPSKLAPRVPLQLYDRGDLCSSHNLRLPEGCYLTSLFHSLQYPEIVKSILRGRFPKLAKLSSKILDDCFCQFTCFLKLITIYYIYYRYYKSNKAASQEKAVWSEKTRNAGAPTSHRKQ